MAIQFIQQLAVDEATGVLYNGVTDLPLSAAPFVIFAGAFAASPLASAVPVGAERILIDPGTGLRSRWYSDGVNWRVYSPTLIARNATLFSGTNTVGEQYLSNLLIPAGMLAAGMQLDYRVGFARSDAVDATVAIVHRLGPLGTIADPVGIVASAAINSTFRSAGLLHQIKVNANTLQKEGTVGSASPSWAGFLSSVIYGSTSSVLNFAVPLFFGVSVNMAAATGTTLPQVTLQELWMLP